MIGRTIGGKVYARSIKPGSIVPNKIQFTPEVYTCQNTYIRKGKRISNQQPNFIPQGNRKRKIKS